MNAAADLLLNLVWQACFFAFVQDFVFAYPVQRSLACLIYERTSEILD